MLCYAGCGRKYSWDVIIFFFVTASRQILGPTQPCILWVPGSVSASVERPGREFDHLMARLRIRGTIAPLPQKSLWRGA